MTPRYQIRTATPDELPTVLNLLAVSAAWMHARGYDAWPPGGFPAERIAPIVELGTVWLVYAEGRPVATLTLDQWADPEFEAAGLDPAAGRALILHKFAILRPAPGGAHPAPGLGALLLDWAADQAHQRGMVWLWLNVARRAEHLQEYYRKHGFEPMALVELPGRKSGSLWRRPALPAAGRASAWER